MASALKSMFAKKSLTEGITLSRGDTLSGDVEAGEGAQRGEGLLSRWFGGQREAESEWIPSLGRKERLVGFLALLGLGVLFFILAGLLVPLIVLKARRFALLFSLGSVCTLGSFSFLWGPWAHLTHIFSLQRVPFTVGYLSTLLLTLYAAVGLHSTPLTLLFGILQLLALLWYTCSYVPGGTAGLCMTEERTEVYLFWNKERPTGSREILFSGATHTASLYWDSKRSHFATTDRLATGMYSGMLLGDDFGPLRAESFQVTSSATFLTIQLRSEVSPATPRPPAPLPKEPPTPDSPGDTLCPPDTPGDTLCPPDTPGDTLYPSDTSGEERRPADYYDHLIGENPYKIPRDILPDRIYQVPSSIPIAQSLATTVKTPLFIPRLKPRNLATHATISVKNSAPHDPCPPSPSQVPVAAPRPPRKVRDGLDIQIRIPSHYDTCSRVSTVLLKQASESGTRATQSGPLPSVLRDAGPPPRTPPPAETPTSPLTTQRRFMLKRPPIASALHRDASGSKASLSSLPVPASRLSTSPLAFVRSPPDISHFPPKLLSMTSDVFEESADYVTLCPLPEETKGGQESSRLLAELHQLREQLSSLRSELKREVSERERLEQEVSSGSKECEHLKTLCANATEERAADQKLLAEERANSGKLKSQILILTNHKIQEKGPKLLKPKPILPKPTKKV